MVKNSKIVEESAYIQYTHTLTFILVVKNKERKVAAKYKRSNNLKLYKNIFLVLQQKVAKMVLIFKNSI